MMGGRVDDARPNLTLAAVGYARMGWAIFPIKGKNHPLISLREASRDTSTIETWWKRWPHANIALATGAPSGIDVLDIDGHEGESALADLVERHGLMPATYESRTSGGRHLFFWADSRMRTTEAVLGPHLNTLGTGNYVVLPPSMHPDERRYVWTVHPKKLDVPARWPRWLVDHLLRQLEAQKRATQGPERSPLEKDFVAKSLAHYAGAVQSAFPNDYVDTVVQAAQELGSLVQMNMLTESELRATLIGAWAKNPDLDKTLDPRQLDDLIQRGLERSGIDWAKAGERVDRKRKGGSGGAGGGGGDDGDEPPDDPDEPESPDEWYWWQDLQKTQKGEVKRSLGNLLIILDNHPSWRECLGLNDRTARSLWMRQPPWDPDNLQGPYPRPIADSDEAFVVKWLEDLLGLEWTSTKVAKALQGIAKLHPFERVREYLEELEWDGKERIDGWLSDYLAARANPLNEAIGSRWLVSAVARTFQPGCQVDHVLVLEGPQGAGKSTAIKALCPPTYVDEWFTDQLGDVRSKDASETLQGAWLVEIAELDALSRAEAHTVKAFITRQVDRYRPSYGRNVVERARRCVFAATTNEHHYLKDATGGRRFWPVSVADKGRALQIERIRKDRDQLWAEAVVRYREGEKWYIDEAKLVAAAMAAQEERYAADEWENLIERWLVDLILDHDCRPDGPRKSLGLDLDSKLRITIGDALKQVGLRDSKDWDRRHQMRAADILGRMGWVRKRRRDGAGGKNRWGYEPTVEAARFVPVPGQQPLDQDPFDD